MSQFSITFNHRSVYVSKQSKKYALITNIDTKQIACSTILSMFPQNDQIFTILGPILFKWCTNTQPTTHESTKGFYVAYKSFRIMLNLRRTVHGR